MSESKIRKLIIAKKEEQFIALKISEVAYFAAFGKAVYAVDGTGEKYPVLHTLVDLEKELDPAIFFRVSRHCLVNVFFIKAFAPFKKVQLKLELNLPPIDEEILVSQLSTPAFKEWIHNI